ncbi:MAG: beta-N-acetylglucosaminidase domain-containing protein [Kiritimatiellae bacterium]|nr:beta-N-acetylglucosaminidase domain-containing protein [Kiritimatiellia bacterium]
MRHVWVAFMMAAMCASGQTNSPFTILGLPYYTGEVFPKAQQAVYKDAFMPMKDIAVVLGKGVDPKDMQIRLLTDKLTGWGSAIRCTDSSSVEKATHQAGDKTMLFLNVAGEGVSAPAKPEGYSVTCYKKDGQNRIAINSHDRLGQLWGIVSVLQLIKREGDAPAMRQAEISDWPEHPLRGCLSGSFGDKSEVVMIFTKANTFVFQLPSELAKNGPQKLLPDIERIAPVFRDLGLNVYFSINPAAPEPKLSTSDKDFERIADWLNQVAALNVGAYFAYDDVRFPVPKADMAKFGSAAETDAYLIPKVFKAVRAKHPNFKMVFCPPFYWGPGTPHTYPEDREVYLKRIGEAFDPEIDIFWTGPRVQSSVITREDVEWMTRLIRRKPWLFQNRGWLPHKYDSSFVTDRITAWKDWRYDGFWKDVSAPLLNLHANQNMMSLASICDYLWNTPAYDAERSVHAAVGTYYGTAAFPLLENMNQALSYFDQYNLPTPAAVKNMAEIERKLAELKTAWEKLLAEAPNKAEIQSLTVFASRVGFAEQFVNHNLKNAASKGFAKFDEWEKDVRKLAIKEAKLADADILITPSQLAGGNDYVIYASRCEPRFATWINGQQSPNKAMSFGFTCEPFPPQGDYEMIICGQEDAVEGKSCNIRVSVGDKTVYEGPSGMPKRAWGLKTFTIPAKDMQRNNRLTFTNMDDGASRVPWFMVNYVVLKKK